jgi:hypothetical protein
MVLRSPNSKNQFLIYTTHIVILGATASCISVFNQVTLTGWAGIWLVILLGEWGVTWWLDVSSSKASNNNDDRPLSKKQIWRNSSWQVGMCLAVFSYFLIVNDFTLRTQALVSSSSRVMSDFTGLGWVTAMAILGFLGMRSSFKSSDMATRISIVGLVVGQ